MSTPIKPLLAVIVLGTTEIGSGLTTAASTSLKRDADEHYGFGDGGKPKIVIGNMHQSGKLTKCWIDKTYLDLVKAGTPVDVVIYPEGKVAGKSTIIVKNAILNSHDWKGTQNAVMAEDISFIGDDILSGTAS